MATLLSQEWVGGRLERTWVHLGDDGRKKLTVEVVQDVEPAIENAKALAQTASRESSFRFKANVTATQIEEACRIQSKVWGVPFRECFSEVMQGKTDRAKRVWRTFTEGRDYAKLQAKHWK
jgi:hypothetical protein